MSTVEIVEIDKPVYVRFQNSIFNVSKVRSFSFGITKMTQERYDTPTESGYFYHRPKGGGLTKALLSVTYDDGSHNGYEVDGVTLEDSSQAESDWAEFCALLETLNR